MGKISSLTQLTGVDVVNDMIPIVDESDSTTKKVAPIDLCSNKKVISVNVEVGTTETVVTTALPTACNLFGVLFKQASRYFMELVPRNKTISIDNNVFDASGSYNSKLTVFASSSSMAVTAKSFVTGFPVTVESIYCM